MNRSICFIALLTCLQFLSACGQGDPSPGLDFPEMKMGVPPVAATPAPCGDSTDDADRKVEICHVPPGNPDHPITLHLSPDGAYHHLRSHAADYTGPCDPQ